MITIMIILYTLLLVALIVGTITDFRVREVPDWVSYSLIGAALGIRLLYSAATSDWSIILEGIAGFGIFLAVAYLMFYAGQWGGGDSKVLMGIGAAIGFNLKLNSDLTAFFAYALVAGAIYGIVYSIVLAAIRKKDFSKEFKKQFNEKQNTLMRRIAYVLSAAGLTSTFFIKEPQLKLMLLLLAFIIFFTSHILIFMKAVEKCCMIKKVKPTQLTEGDWILKDVNYRGKYLCGPKDLGIEKKQIRKLIALYSQKKIKTVTIKEGIPFVPSFLIALIVLLVWGNLLGLLP